MPTLRGHKYQFLINSGLTPKEASEFSSNYIYSDGTKGNPHYSMNQLRTLPYFRKLLRSRRLYVSNLKKQGYTDNQIRQSIAYLYFRKEWITEGEPDPWVMLRSYRTDSIIHDEYKRARRKGSHHPKGSGISKGDIQKQRMRSTFREKSGKTRVTGRVQDTLDKITGLNKQIDRTTNLLDRQRLTEQRNKLWKSIA